MLILGEYDNTTVMFVPDCTISTFCRKKVLRLLEEELSTLRPLQIWPFNSPEINSIGYWLWSVVQYVFIVTSNASGDYLQAAIRKFFRNLNSDEIERITRIIE